MLRASKYFRGIFISQEIGINKPQKGFFDYCFNEIPDFLKEKTIIVGDSLTSDIKGGNNAGIQTCWYNPRGIKCPDDVTVNYEIKDILQLKNILK